MRPKRRRWLVGLASLTLILGALSLASPAGAADETEEQCLVNAVEELGGEVPAEGEELPPELETAVQECKQAESPLLPELNEIIWGVFGFVVVLFFLWKFGLPPIKESMNARSERIRGDLESAETQRTEAEGVLADYRSQLAEAKTESARIIEEARQTADSMRRDLEAQAEADVADMRRKAAEDIEVAKAQAITDLRGEVASIAISAAEAVVDQNLDAEANTRLVENFIDEVGATPR